MKRQLMRLTQPLIRPMTAQILTTYYRDTRPTTEPTENRVLILAPHVDDETIGLGGTIMRYKNRTNPAQVHVCYLTDGAGSVSDAGREDLIQARKQEAKAVEKLFDLDSVTFLDKPDGQLIADAETVSTVRQMIDDMEPDIVYVTPHVDCHPDHVAAGNVLAEALINSTCQPDVRTYEINTTIPKNYINTVVDITPHFKTKDMATTIFQSQAIDFDGLMKRNQYQAHLVSDSNVKHAEVFRTYSAFEWVETIRQAKNFSFVDFQNELKQMNKELTMLLAHKKGYKFKTGVYDETVKRREQE
ncbi:LmbE family N-acetylglucosaminyl deacetylase [Alkalibacillus flavidus]|uniref:LmbE family N-acetylglucosaminyl deacetylase n=1 Tax=Alkalibacillus flavidus TaxID=546021 RepID=A0ABV2KYM0_9BACI